MKRRLSVPVRVLLSIVLIGMVSAYGVWRLSRDCGFVMGAMRGNLRLVEAELDAGVPVDEPTWQGINALQAAAYGGHEEIVRLLLSRGANPQNGLRQAERMHRTRIIALLKRMGAKE